MMRSTLLVAAVAVQATSGQEICCLAQPTCPEGYRQLESNRCRFADWLFGRCRYVSLCCSRIACQKVVPLREGDVCYQFCEDGSCAPVNRRDDCPAGTSCKSTGGIGFNSHATCQKAGKGCTLDCGTKVQDGWSGNGEGPNQCNRCSCLDGALVCTEAFCGTQCKPKGFDTKGYYRVERDFRKCAYPRCGGYWVSLANLKQTQCADGTLAERCYVSDIEPRVGQLQGPQKLVKGQLVGKQWEGIGTVGLLQLETDHTQASDEAGQGVFVGVKDNGVRCITFPCFSLTQYHLNTGNTQQASSISFSPSLDTTLVQWANDKIFRGEVVVVAGSHKETSGPAGKGTELVVQQIYQPVAQKR